MLICFLVGMVIGIRHGIIEFRKGNIHGEWWFIAQVAIISFPITAISIIEKNVLIIFYVPVIIGGYLTTSIAIPRFIKMYKK